MKLFVMCFHSNKLVVSAWRRKDCIKIAAINSIAPTFKINETIVNSRFPYHSFIRKIKSKPHGVFLVK